MSFGNPEFLQWGLIKVTQEFMKMIWEVYGCTFQEKMQELGFTDFVELERNSQYVAFACRHKEFKDKFYSCV